VKEISEYSRATSDYELFSFFYDRVLNREIVSFSALRECAGPLMRDPRIHPVLLKVFELIKTLNWGYFSQMSRETHRQLWEKLVIADKDLVEAGDLKRTLSIPDLYVAMLDIHGYTKFCQDSRKNLSMLHTLDRAINHDVRDISARCGAVSQRERGDEIVVVAASASDALTVTLAIIDYFGKTSVLRDPAVPVRRSGDAAILPAFKISAGITGGNTSSPLIITEQGNLAGFLLNSGARLQVRADELSPTDSRVMVTKQVQMHFSKENSGDDKCALFTNDTIYFLDTGTLEFKGVLLPTCEAIFRTEDRYKEQFSAEMTALFTSINGNLWEQKIFTDLMQLLIKAAGAMPLFTCALDPPVRGLNTATSATVRQLCEGAVKAWVQDEDYAGALDLLRGLIAVMERIPRFDRLVLDYARGICARYDLLLEDYIAALDQEIDKNAAALIPPDQFRTYNVARNAVRIYENFRLQSRRSPALTKKKALWYKLIKANQDKMTMTLYSGKK
jgi:hypothetical protein